MSMQKEEKFWLVAYDIRDGRRLARVAACMECYGWRVQQSVFEVKASEHEMETLRRLLRREIDEEEDFVLIFCICERDVPKCEVYGKTYGFDPMKELFLVL